MPPRPRNSHLLDQVRLGDEIEVWWPHDAQYYSGVVGCHLPSGRHRILYNDGEVEDLRLATEQWRFIGTAAQRVLAIHSSPPPLHPPSSAGHSRTSAHQPLPPPQIPPLNESASTANTPPAKKRGRPKGRKSDSTKSATSKTPRTNNNTSQPHQNASNISRPNHPPPTSSAPQKSSALRKSTTKVKKRQRPSSTTVQNDNPKTTSDTSDLQHPSLPDLDPGLIDAAPLRVTAPNPAPVSNPAPSAPKPSPTPVTPVVPKSRNPSERVHAPLRNASADHPNPAQVASATPSDSPTKPLPVNALSVLGNPPSNVESAKLCAAPAKDSPCGDLRAPPSSKALDLETGRRKTPSSSLEVRNVAHTSKVPSDSCAKQQPPKEAEKDNRVTKSTEGNISSKKEAASENVLAKHSTPTSLPREAGPGQTSVSHPTPPKQPIAPKPNSAAKPPVTTRGLRNDRKTLNSASAISSGASVHGEKGTHAKSDKTSNQRKETHGKDASRPAQTKLPTLTGDNGTTGEDPVKQDSLKGQVKASPVSVPWTVAESSTTPKTMPDAFKPLTAAMARAATNSENRPPASDMDRPLSSPTDSSSIPSHANLKATGSPRNSMDSVAKRGGISKRGSIGKRGGVVKRGSRPSADAKDPSKSRGTNVGKSSAANKPISKPTKFVLKKQAIAALASRKQTDSNNRRAGVNPDDGSDIIADVTVPRKARSGPTSPLLRSPLSGLKRPLFSPSRSESISGGLGQKPTNEADLTIFSLQSAPAARPSLKGDRSPPVKGDRAGSKLAPFQPTKRRSLVHRQSTTSQEEQRSRTESLPKSPHSKLTLHPSPIPDKEQRLADKAKSSRSDSQHEALVKPALSNSAPDHANQESGTSKERLPIPDSEQSRLVTRRTSGVGQSGSNSTLKKPVSESSQQAKKDLIQSARVNPHESVDRAKQSKESAENAVARAMSDMNHADGDLSQPQHSVSREKHPNEIVNETKNGAVRAPTTPGPTMTTTNKPETSALGNGGVKRTASEPANKVKRRKLDSCKKQPLGQVVNATTPPASGNNSSHITKILPGSSPPTCENSLLEPEKFRSKESSNTKDYKTKLPPPTSTQTKRETAEVAKVDHAEKDKGGRAKTGRNMRAGLGASGRVQSERVDGKTEKDIDSSRMMESRPSAVTAPKATVSKSPLLPQQAGSIRDASMERGVGIAQLSAHHPDVNRPCPESDTQIPASAEVAASKESSVKPSNGKDQPAQQNPDPPLKSNEAKMSQGLPPPSMTSNGTRAHEPHPATSAPRSFARVRARQTTSSVPTDEDLRLTAGPSQDPDKATASLSLDILARTITEANRKSLQAGLAPLSSRFEKFFTDNDKCLRSLQGQVETATKAMESLQKGVVGVHNAVSSLPSTTEFKTFLESHTEETKQAMTQELKSVTSELKYSLHDYLKRELESAMKSVAMQIQRDSVMLISKAIDNAMSSGLMQDHPRIGNDSGKEVGSEGPRVQQVPEGRSEANREGDLARYTGLESDDIPLARRFSLVPGTRKERPFIFADTASRSLAPAGSQSQPGARTRNGVSPPDSDVRGGASGNAESMAQPSSQTTQDASQKPQRNCLASLPAANVSGKERSTLPADSRKPIVQNCIAQSSDEMVCSRDKRARVPEKEGPEVGPKGVDIIMRNKKAPGTSVSADLQNNPVRVPAKDPARESPVKASVAGKKPNENAKDTPTRDPARRERYKQLTLQVRTLLARCAVEWFLSGGCRDFAPPNERTVSVSGTWVTDSVLRCLDGIVRRLENEDTFEDAMKDLADSVGPGIQTDWLLKGPTVSNINAARENYTEWDPQLYDFEWESEKRVLGSLSEELIASEERLVGSGEIYEDLLQTAMRCVQNASERNAAPR